MDASLMMSENIHFVDFCVPSPTFYLIIVMVSERRWEVWCQHRSDTAPGKCPSPSRGGWH